MSLFNSGTRSSLLRQATSQRTTARAGYQFSTSASTLQIRADSTFFSSNNAKLNSGFPLARQQAGQGAQRWEGTLRSGPGAKRNFSVSYGSLALLLILPSSFYLLGSIYPPSTLSLLFPRPAPPPLRADSEEGRQYTQKLEQELQNLSIVKEMRAMTVKPDGSEGDWYETRPMAKSMHPHSLTSSVLRGPSMFALPPLAFVKNNEHAAIIVIHVGRSLCGHDGIIHGGLLATVLDESLGRNALLNIPSKIGVTATLNVQYKKPTKADQFIIVRTELDSVAGRKVNVSGSIESLDGEILATAQALFVEPKYAQYLKNSGVAAALGERPRPRILDMDDTKEERVTPPQVKK